MAGGGQTPRWCRIDYEFVLATEGDVGCVGGVGGADDGGINERGGAAGGMSETGGKSGDDKGEGDAFDGVHGGEE